MDKEALLNGYFDHTLSESELVAFNELLATDASFAEELAFRKNVKQSIHINERARIKATLKQFESNTTKQPFRRKYFAWIAAATTITFILIALNQYTQKPKPSALFQQFYTGYPNIIAPTERSNSEIDSLTKAGKEPSWTTVRQRFWKNEAFNNSGNYSPENVLILRKELAPQRYNEALGKWESMELHHIPPMREGGLYDFIKVWPDEHRAIDPFRH